MSKKRILTILGTRPEIIRLSRIIPKLDEIHDHFLLHTGQNYDANLSDVFFQDLRLRAPDRVLDSTGSLAEQVASIFCGVEQVINEFKPDAVLVLGDTNSALSAIIAERMNVRVFHMEAGNRCHDWKVPEEKNRRIIDAISSVNLPYTYGSCRNLIAEGITDVTVTGNPILEVLDYYKEDINKSTILTELNLEPNNYVIATAHRAENVDDAYRLENIAYMLNKVSEDYPVVFSCHPRTAQKMEKYGVKFDSGRIIQTKPLGFFDFVHLEKHARLAITDSGTVQEEACIFHVPAVTIRDTTERPETVVCGSNMVSGLNTERMLSYYEIMLNSDRIWNVPGEYTWPDVSDRIISILADV